MNRLLKASLLLIAILVGQTVIAAEISEVTVLDIHPTQPAAGYAATEAARLLQFRNVKDEATLREAVLNQKPLSAVRGPDGGIYLTDGHHRALGIFRAASAICESPGAKQAMDTCMRGIRVRVKVQGDYSKRSWNEFVDELLRENNIYLPRPIREKLVAGELSKEQIFRKNGGVLPSSLGKLANDPMRSAIGALFYDQGINGDLFANYLEFLVAERIGDRIIVQAGQEFDPKVQFSLGRAIFNDGELVRYIRCLARRDGEEWKRAQQMINQTVGLEAAAPFEPSSCETGR